MDIKKKYRFDFNWFLNTYNNIHYPKSVSNLDINTKEFIDKIYNIHYLNYDGFLDEVLLHLKELDTKQEYLKAETKCIKCNFYYPYLLDSFIFIKLKTDNNQFNDITHQLCFNCIRNLEILSCSKCYNLELDTYDSVYLDNLKDQFICKKCYH